MRIKLTINYNGAGFVGWQRQKGGGSIQDFIEGAIFKLTGENVSLTGSGRTDAGVHALMQVAHFDLNKPFDAARIPPALNFYLPESIRVQSAEEVLDIFHARKSVKHKTYIYVMYKNRFENALYSGRALRIAPEADTELMKEAATQFLGRHDFYAFMSAGSSAKTTIRTVFESEIIEQNSLFPAIASVAAATDLESKDANKPKRFSTIANVETTEKTALNPKKERQSILTCENFCTPPLIIYKVTADGFLYNMVRKLTACILNAGLKKISPADIPALIEARNRELCKDLVKPHGLYLYSVEY